MRRSRREGTGCEQGLTTRASPRRDPNISSRSFSLRSRNSSVVMVARIAAAEYGLRSGWQARLFSSCVKEEASVAIR